MSKKTLQIIWEQKPVSECIKIPEDDATLKQIRHSIGMEIDHETYTRFRLVPKELVE